MLELVLDICKPWFRTAGVTDDVLFVRKVFLALSVHKWDRQFVFLLELRPHTRCWGRRHTTKERSGRRSAARERIDMAKDSRDRVGLKKKKNREWRRWKEGIKSMFKDQRSLEAFLPNSHDFGPASRQDSGAKRADGGTRRFSFSLSLLSLFMFCP